MTRRRTLWLGWLLAVLAIAGFVRLGVWQSQRAVEKRAMLDAAASVLARRQAHPLEDAGAAARAQAYDWAAGRGRFADAPPLLLDNQLREGRAGVRVYRLFEPGSGVPLLVDLGWLPLAGDRSLPALQAAPAGPVELRGLLAPPPSAGLRLGPAMARKGPVWLLARFDTAAIARELGVPALAPRVLRLDPAQPLGYARDLELLANTLPPDKHRGYAVQWFGLALTVLATALILTFRRPRR